jgi:hypothetical protein
MADGLAIESGAEPPAKNYATSELDPFEDRDAPVLLAAAKVAAIHELCVRMNDEHAPRDPSFAVLASERRDALEALMALPASTTTECSAKLDILLKVTPWIGHEDTQLFDFMVDYAQEVTNLFKNSVPHVPLQAEPPRAALGRSVRWFLGVVLPGAILGRWDSGGLS